VPAKAAPYAELTRLQAANVEGYSEFPTAEVPVAGAASRSGARRDRRVQDYQASARAQGTCRAMEGCRQISGVVEAGVEHDHAKR
jgi:hypothetical protein